MPFSTRNLPYRLLLPAPCQSQHDFVFTTFAQNLSSGEVIFLFIARSARSYSPLLTPPPPAAGARCTSTCRCRRNVCYFIIFFFIIFFFFMLFFFIIVPHLLSCASAFLIALSKTVRTCCFVRFGLSFQFSTAYLVRAASDKSAVH